MSRDASRGFDAALMGLALALSAGLLLWLMNSCSSGIDFSDEGFYLLWMANPSLYKVSVTQFGFLYHPVYVALGGELPALRRFNVLCTWALAFALSLAVLRAVARGVERPAAFPGPAIGVAALLLSSSAMALLYLWLPTPNYNSLALQALLIAATGAVLAARRAAGAGLWGWCLLGIGGWLCFMAKPTTAAALAVATALYLALSGKFSVTRACAAIALAAALVAASALAIDGSLAAFAQRLAEGSAEALALGGGHTLGHALRLDSFSLAGREERLFWFLAAVAGAQCWAFRRGGAFAIAAAAVAAVLLLAALAVTAGLVRPEWTYRAYGPIQLAAPLSGALLAAAAGQWRERARWRMGAAALPLYLAVLPYAFAFGTIENYWSSGLRAGIFLVLAGVAAMALRADSSSEWRVIIGVGVLVEVVTVGLLATAMNSPYRQAQPLWNNTATAAFRPGGPVIRLPAQAAQYLEELHEIARSRGLEPGTPVIDLTGRYPGALAALGARAIGRPWLIGAYQGSAAVARASLDRVPCDELGRAWLLTEPDGPRRLDPALLRRYGIEPDAAFEVAGTALSPAGEYPERHAQFVFRPTTSPEVARERCQSLRGASS